jgi:hypothetical protein
VGLIGQVLGVHFTPQAHFCPRLVLKAGPPWCSSFLAKVNKTRPTVGHIFEMASVETNTTSQVHPQLGRSVHVIPTEWARSTSSILT